MTIIKRKTFIIKHFARIAEQTDLQKKTKYCDVSVTRLLAACFRKRRQVTEFLPIRTKRICIHCFSMFCMPKDAFQRSIFTT